VTWLTEVEVNEVPFLMDFLNFCLTVAKQQLAAPVSGDLFFLLSNAGLKCY